MPNKEKRTEIPDAESDSTQSSGAEPVLDRVIQNRIGDHLRAMYDELLQQPVPDRFRELLARLPTRDGDPS